MSEQAPEMIGIRLDDMTAARNAYFARPIPERFIQIDVIPYRRADLVWLPETLECRLREMIQTCWGDIAKKEQAPMEQLLRDILAALEPTSQL